MSDAVNREALASRRRFLLAAGAALAAPVLVTGCRRQPGATGPGAPAALPAEPIVRVRLRAGAGGRHAVGPDSAWIRVVEEPSQREVFLLGPVDVGREPDGWRLRDASGFEPDLDAGAALRVEAMFDDEPAATIDVNGRAHPGWVRAVPTETGVHLVNHVEMEQYLPGVLTGELFPTWHEETFAAQSIAARSFALVESRLNTRRHYDVRQGPISQAYIGVTDLPRAIDAVARTRGVVLMASDEPMPGYYSSCCGGTAACAVDAIGSHPVNALPPLSGRPGPDPCSKSPRYRWSVTRPRRGLEARLRAAGTAGSGPKALAELGRLRAIEVERVNLHGRPTSYTVRGTKERVVVDAEILRRATARRASGLPEPTRLHSSDFKVVVDGNDVVFRGRGFGHGVGLCQYGAQTLALDGAVFDAILAWYYPGAALDRAYV